MLARMYSYRICGRHLESNLPLPELLEGAGAAADSSFLLLPGPSPAPEPAAWIHQWAQPDGTPWSSLSRYQQGYLLRFHGMADFLLSDDCVQIRCFSVNGTPDATLRHLLLDQVFPLALSRQGHLVLHCSAVVTPLGAVAFAGGTGMGKSTLTASFAHSGVPVLTDDGLLVQERHGKLVGFPSYPGLRLWDDSLAAIFPANTSGIPVAHYTTKVRVALGRDMIPFCDEPSTIRRIYFLGLANEICIEPLAPGEGFMEVVKQSYRLDLRDQERLRREFERLRHLAALTKFRRLSFACDFGVLPAVQEAILQDLQREDSR